MSVVVDFPPPFVIIALIAFEGNCGLMAHKMSAYTSMCIIRLFVFDHLVSSDSSLLREHIQRSSTLFSHIIGIQKSFPVSFFEALQLPLIFRLSLISGSALAAESVSSLRCFSISCLRLFSIPFVAKSSAYPWLLPPWLTSHRSLTASQISPTVHLLSRPCSASHSQVACFQYFAHPPALTCVSCDFDS